MDNSAIVGVWGALLVLALVTSAISLWLHWRAGSTRELMSQVRQIENDLGDLHDTFQRYENRQKVRNLRDGRAAATQPLTPQPGTPEYKAYLRRKARGEVPQ